MNIGFIGLGKLGLPCALAVESRGHKVVGYDPSEQVKDIIDSKKLQYQEIWAQEHLEKSKIEIKSMEEVVGESEIISLLWHRVTNSPALTTLLAGSIVLAILAFQLTVSNFTWHHFLTRQ